MATFKKFGVEADSEKNPFLFFRLLIEAAHGSTSIANKEGYLYDANRHAGTSLSLEQALAHLKQVETLDMHQAGAVNKDLLPQNVSQAALLALALDQYDQRGITFRNAMKIATTPL